MDDIYNLSRFLDAQSINYSSALSEIQKGRKTTHWMWYIFPQITGLGRSPISEYYAIKSLDEAKAYINNSILAYRLREASQALLVHSDKSIKDILGSIDSMKLKSSMTLFDLASPNDVFSEVLKTFFASLRDTNTLLKIME
jgi:uncharacterized protein (DUF1810 family)